MAGDASDINRSIFNEEAASYDEKHRKLNERLTRELQARLDFIAANWASDDEDSDGEQGTTNNNNSNSNKTKREVRLFDYACGTGMMSRALAPYTTQCIGMDISEKMVAAYNTRAENQGLSHDEMHAVLGDLGSETVSESLSSPELFNFDIAVVGGGFHHFGNPALAAKRLVERLKPGGVLLIWDFLPHGPRHQHGHGGHHDHGHDHGHRQKTHDVYHSVMHHGFSEPQMREIFTAAGAGADFRLEAVGGGFVLGHGQQHGHEGNTAPSGKWDDENGDSGAGAAAEDKDQAAFRREVFFARGTKADVRT